jgi:hypothetical protein
MIHFWNTFLTGVICIFLVSRIHAMFLPHSERRDDVLYELDKELHETIVKANKGKYGFFSSPQMSKNGLTYVIVINAFLKNVKCRSVEEVELIHKHIYEDLFKQLCSIRVIRPFLAEFPLTAHSVHINLDFYGEKNEKCRPPYLSGVIARGTDFEFLQIVMKDIRFEDKIQSVPDKDVVKVIPLSEASWMKQFLSTSIPRSKSDHPIKVPEYVQPSPHSSPMSQAVFSFERAFCKANNLHIVSFGDAGAAPDKSRAFTFILRGEQQVSLEEAQRIARSCSKGLFDFVCHNQTCLDYMQERSTWEFLKDPAIFPEPRHLGFRISFWDENVDRPSAPYIAEIRLFDSVLQYFTADENQILKLTYEEPFEAAIEAIQPSTNIESGTQE